MKIKFAVFMMLCVLPCASFAREGTPSYYKNNNYGPSQYQMPAQNVFVGNQQPSQIVGQRVNTMHVPRQTQDLWSVGGGGMTPNGVSIPPENNPYDFVISAEYTRRFADFQFETGVQSVLEWDDMIINEFGFRVEKDFKLREFDLFAYGEYKYGTISHGGMSMDYDLKPYDESEPMYGVFTVSIGEQNGSTQNMKFGVGARHIWDIGGWKLSPSIGYQIFSHDLQMSDHIYPNPAVYVPLMTQDGAYIFSDLAGGYYPVYPGVTPDEGLVQVCMTPEDMALAMTDPAGYPVGDLDGNLLTVDYNPIYGYLPWGVGPGECVVIGGDGVILVPGTTHIYNTTWSGIYLGLEIEKRMTFVDKLRFYFQVSMPHYKSEGTWPNRTDWQQNPSFIDEGDNGAMHYMAEMEYSYQFSERIQLTLKASMEHFSVGKIPGELYVAGYNYYETDSEGNILYDEITGAPILGYQPPYTETVSDSLKSAVWQSFGLHLGVKYAF